MASVRWANLSSPVLSAQAARVPHAGDTRLLEDARRAALDDGTPQGPLVIGSFETTAALRLAPLLTGFAAAHPAVDLTLCTEPAPLDDVLGPPRRRPGGWWRAPGP